MTERQRESENWWEDFGRIHVEEILRPLVDRVTELEVRVSGLLKSGTALSYLDVPTFPSAETVSAEEDVTDFRGSD